MDKKKRLLSLQEAKTQLGISLNRIYYLIRTQKLSKIIINGCSFISWSSIHKHIINRFSRIPPEYCSIKKTCNMLKIKKEIVLSAIDRGDIKTREFNNGLILEKYSVLLWGKTLRETKLIHQEKKMKDQQSKTQS